MTVHLRLPIALGSDGTFLTVAEDSDGEVVQNVAVILRTREGERLATPEFGTPDPTFTGLDIAAVLPVVEQYEPRADLDVVQHAITAVSTVTVTSVPRAYGEGKYGEGGYGSAVTYATASSSGTQVTDITVRRQES